MVIHEGVFIFNVYNLKIGNNVTIHPMCYIEAKGGLELGSDISIAHNVTILTTTHNTEDINVNINKQGISNFPTTILDNVWIGCKATILCGRTINYGTIIGANSVVTKDFAQNLIIAGNPATVIKQRI